MKKLTVLVLAGCVLLFSCSKNDNDDPVDPDPNGSEAAQKLQKDIVGKYSFPGISLEKRGRPSLPSTTAPAQHTWSGSREPKPTEDPPTNPQSFIEFTADSLFIILDENGTLYTGKYLARSGDSITLHNIGGLSKITINGNKLDFKLTYANGAKWANLNTNKAPVITGNNLTEALSHSWYLTKEDDGAEDFTDADSVSFIFSAYGTYLAEFFNKGKVLESNPHNWKWHSSKANTFVYKWIDDPAFDEEDDQVIIREVTSEVLRFSEYWDDNADGIDEEHKYKLLRAHVK